VPASAWTATPADALAGVDDERVATAAITATVINERRERGATSVTVHPLDGTSGFGLSHQIPRPGQNSSLKKPDGSPENVKP
jgi:hypothetical protein